MSDFVFSDQDEGQVVFDYTEGSDKEIFDAKIKVIGVGGGGGNAVRTMLEQGISGVEFMVANTDAQALRSSPVPQKLHMGKHLTKGLGAGGKPEVGNAAAQEDAEALRDMLKDSDMVFVTAGMGGGTGTGAAPVIASIAKELGALTVGVVTKPFAFEGRRRMRNADEGLLEFRKTVDTVITIPNQQLLGFVDKKTPLSKAFAVADDVLCNAVKGISELITVSGLINLDFADVQTIMGSKGMALMGAGIGTGDDRASEAARNAINSPLLEESCIEGARGLLINVTGGPSFSLHEANEAASLITDEADPDAEIIFGAVIDENMGESVSVTVIATGFKNALDVYQDNDARGNGTRVASMNKEKIRSLITERLPKTGTDHNLESMGSKEILRSIKMDQPYFDDDLEIPTFIRKHAD